MNELEHTILFEDKNTKLEHHFFPANRYGWRKFKQVSGENVSFKEFLGLCSY